MAGRGLWGPERKRHILHDDIESIYNEELLRRVLRKDRKKLLLLLLLWLLLLLLLSSPVVLPSPLWMTGRGGARGGGGGMRPMSKAVKAHTHERAPSVTTHRLPQCSVMSVSGEIRPNETPSPSMSLTTRTYPSVPHLDGPLGGVERCLRLHLLHRLPACRGGQHQAPVPWLLPPPPALPLIPHIEE